MWQKKIKKTIFTLNVDNYDPKITELTYPLIERYAYKVGADFHIINKRKFPKMPVVYEKLQIYELAQQMENDWNIYFDSDALIHPDFMDVTTLVPKDTVLQYGCDVLTTRFRNNRFFQRDGRNISACNWFTVASDLCIDLWKPPKEKLEDMVEEICPLAKEERVFPREHLIDDYIFSYNLAKYGLKYTTLRAKLKELGYERCEYLWHHYLYDNTKKVEKLKYVLSKWKFFSDKNLHPLEAKKNENTLCK